MHRFADGTTVEYTDQGSGLPVVLLHAFAADRALWEPQVRALSARYRIIAPDLRGFGGSTPTTGEAVSMDQYAADVRALLDHLRIERAVIGGISLGGYVALAFVLRYPGRTAGLVLANTRAVGDDAALAQDREALIGQIQLRGAEAVVDSYGDKPFATHCPQGTRDRVREIFLRQPIAGLVSGTRGMMTRPDRTAALGSIVAPTLVVHGACDQFIAPAAGRLMHERIAGSAYVEIPGAGHLSNVDTPEAFNQALDAFLQPLSLQAQR